MVFALNGAFLLGLNALSNVFGYNARKQDAKREAEMLREKERQDIDNLQTSVSDSTSSGAGRVLKSDVNTDVAKRFFQTPVDGFVQTPSIFGAIFGGGTSLLSEYINAGFTLPKKKSALKKSMNSIM